MKSHMTNSFDLAFDSIVSNGLCWYPWVGKNYQLNDKKILVVGESHYANNNEKDPAEQMCNVDHVADDINFTRYIIYESRILKDYAPKTLDNINRVLVGCNNFEGKLLWNNIAFYNFIQRPMKTVDERPSWEDFLNGWRTFADVVKILKPTACIFIGNSAANFFNEAMTALGEQHNKVIWTKFINRAWAKKAEIVIEGKYIPVHFTRHAGRFFSWSVWHQYLEETLPEAIGFIKNAVKVSEKELEEFDDTIVVERHTTKGLPLNLNHKPIIAANYQTVNSTDYSDAKFLSVGRAQYNPENASVKIFRKPDNGRWSRQSEEVPIQRLGFMMEMLLAAMLRCQNADSTPSELQEEIIAPQDMDFLLDEIRKNRQPIFESLSRIKAYIEEINSEKF